MPNLQRLLQMLMQAQQNNPGGLGDALQGVGGFGPAPQQRTFGPPGSNVGDPGFFEPGGFGFGRQNGRVFGPQDRLPIRTGFTPPPGFARDDEQVGFGFGQQGNQFSDPRTRLLRRRMGGFGGGGSTQNLSGIAARPLVPQGNVHGVVKGLPESAKRLQRIQHPGFLGNNFMSNFRGANPGVAPPIRRAPFIQRQIDQRRAF